MSIKGHIGTTLAALGIALAVSAMPASELPTETDWQNERGVTVYEAWKGYEGCRHLAHTDSEYAYCAHVYNAPDAATYTTDPDYMYPHNDSGWPYPCNEDEYLIDLTIYKGEVVGHNCEQAG